MISELDLERWPHLARKPLGYWLISEIARPRMRITTTAARGTDEVISHFETTKTGMARHLDRLEKGGFDVRWMRKELD